MNWLSRSTPCTFSILSRLGLTNRIVGKGDTADLFDAVDWTDVDVRLQQARQSSLTYLRAALSNASPAPSEAAAEASALPQLADHNHCTGCGACFSVCPRDAITMKRDQEGFAYPAVNDDTCIHCGRCTCCMPSASSPAPGTAAGSLCRLEPDDAVRKATPPPAVSLPPWPSMCWKTAESSMVQPWTATST